VTFPPPSFAHLCRLTDDKGLFEHAKGTVARRDGGYCVDDVARALIVVTREQKVSDTEDLRGLSEVYLSFLLEAQAADGRFHNRLGLDRVWHDLPSTDDCWGRALWALGSVAAAFPDTDVGGIALAAFELGAVRSTLHVRSIALASLGAFEVLRLHPGHRIALALVEAAIARIGRPLPSTSWPWPEERLSYGNALLPEVLLGAGAELRDESLLEDGLSLLGWLLDVETHGQCLSVTPVGGRGPGDHSPAFDQQPIEVAAIADACARAFAITGDLRWATAVELAAGWFLGANDSATSLYDATSGGGCDGLERLGRNENQGAESTIAVISTLQQARGVAA
jgi:hypothetical protein